MALKAARVCFAFFMAICFCCRLEGAGYSLVTFPEEDLQKKEYYFSNAHHYLFDSGLELNDESEVFIHLPDGSVHLDGKSHLDGTLYLVVDDIEAIKKKEFNIIYYYPEEVTGSFKEIYVLTKQEDGSYARSHIKVLIAISHLELEQSIFHARIATRDFKAYLPQEEIDQKKHELLQLLEYRGTPGTAVFLSVLTHTQTEDKSEFIKDITSIDDSGGLFLKVKNTSSSNLATKQAHEIFDINELFQNGFLTEENYLLARRYLQVVHSAQSHLQIFKTHPEKKSYYEKRLEEYEVKLNQIPFNESFFTIH